MPEISRFFGIIVRMYYDDHPPPHIHAEYQGNKAKIDFGGNVLLGDLRSKTALIFLRKRGLGSCFLVEVNSLTAALKALW
jgi:hypothetical protein